MDARIFSIVLAGSLIVVGGCNAEPAAPVKSPLAGVLVINEFMASNQNTIADEDGEFADWVELYNAGDTAVNLRSMYMTDDLARPMKWSFPDTAIAARGYMLVWCDGAYREGPLHASFKLGKEGEQLGLYWTDGERLAYVDTLTYGPQGTDTSYGRLPDGGEWRFLSVPSPGSANTTGVSPLWGRLFINEFMASNQSTVADEAGDYDDWVELYNAGSTAVALGGLGLTDNFAQPARWQFPDTSLTAGGYLLVWADDEAGEGPLHACFNLGAARGEQLGLFATSNGHALLIDTVAFGTQRTDTSYGRLPDGGPEWQFLSSPTPGAANHGRK
jgi:hypothetical protein